MAKPAKVHPHGSIPITLAMGEVELAQLDALVAELRSRGVKLASRSSVTRLALRQFLKVTTVDQLIAL